MKHIQLTALFANIMDPNNFTTVNSDKADKLDLSAPILKDSINILLAHEYALCLGDEDIADELLADLEPCLRQLTWAQNEWLRGLSGDLHMLNNEETFQRNPYPPHLFWMTLREAWADHQNDPGRVLTLLRYQQEPMPADEIAFMRSQAYVAYGFLNVAIAFIQVAASINPNKSGYEVLLMNLFSKTDRNDELNHLIEQVFSSSNSSPEMLVCAAFYSFIQLRTVVIGEARPRLGQLRKRLQGMFTHTSPDRIMPRVAFLGFYLLGHILVRLRRLSEAQEYYKRANKIEPENDEVLVALAASMLLDQNREALEIFDELVSKGTDQDTPYLFMAKKAADEKRFDDCVRHSEALLKITSNSTMKGYALQFLGICEVEQNGATDKAKDLLMEAINFLPDDVILRENLEAIQKNGGNHANTKGVKAEELLHRLHLRPDELHLPASLQENFGFGNVSTQFFSQTTKALSGNLSSAMAA